MKPFDHSHRFQRPKFLLVIRFHPARLENLGIRALYRDRSGRRGHCGRSTGFMALLGKQFYRCQRQTGQVRSRQYARDQSAEYKSNQHSQNSNNALEPPPAAVFWIVKNGLRRFVRHLVFPYQTRLRNHARSKTGALHNDNPRKGWWISQSPN